MFLPSNAVRLARKQPRRPDFLLEPLQSQRPLGYDTFWERVDRGPGPPKARGTSLQSQEAPFPSRSSGGYHGLSSSCLLSAQA